MFSPFCRISDSKIDCINQGTLKPVGHEHGERICDLTRGTLTDLDSDYEHRRFCCIDIAGSCTAVPA